MKINFFKYSFVLVLLALLFLTNHCFKSSKDETQGEANTAVTNTAKKEVRNLSASNPGGLANSLSIPLNTKGKWQVLKYDDFPANKVSFSSQGMSIRVKGSASPLIYPLTDKPLHIKGVSITGYTDKLVSINPPGKQGAEDFDDFNLRLGFVFLGSNTLSFFQKQIASDWVLKMFELAPKNQGVDHIFFLSATLSAKQLNKTRVHPSGRGYIKESNVWLMDKPGDFSYLYNFVKAQRTGALWISVDGDDTGSSFNTHIESITIQL